MTTEQLRTGITTPLYGNTEAAYISGLTVGQVRYWRQRNQQHCNAPMSLDELRMMMGLEWENVHTPRPWLRLSEHVVIVPGVCSSRPIVAGIPVRSLVKRYSAGESVEAIAHDCGISARAVQGAIDWHEGWRS